MRRIDLAGKAQTVLGPIATEDLGVTLPHEHLLSDTRIYFVEPTEPSQKLLAHQPISLENFSWVHRHILQNLDNLQMFDEEVAISEAMLFKRSGGNTIVECTTIGIGRDPLGLARIARATGLNIIMGAGYYIGQSHPPDMDRRSEEEITEEIVRDITVGVGDTGVRAGIIGEIGCSWPLQDNERKVLRAAGRAQQLTGAPLTIHPGRNEAASLEIIDVLAHVGADLSRTIIEHIPSRVRDPGNRRKLAEEGCYLEYDLFGGDTPGWELSDWVDAATDAQCITEIAQLISEGYLTHILISHDCGTKIRLSRYGGPGYAHILNNIVPLMRKRGYSEEQIHTILIDNPRRVLSFV